jgi:excisionase family DNA binding protein
VFAAEHDTTISDVLRNLLENWLHFNFPSVLPTISVPDPPVVKGPPRLLRLEEVANHFQVSRETVRRWVRDRLIVAIRGGRRGGYLFDPADILKFRSKRTTGGRP